MYVVVDAEGRLLVDARGVARLYENQSFAEARCRVNGDSVIAVRIDLTKKPLYIRGKVLKVS